MGKMKVGLSFSRCLLDIVEGRVDIKDVLVVISRTNLDPRVDEEWSPVWDGYINGGYSQAEWRGHDKDEKAFRELAIQLLTDGKLHQPRQFGQFPGKVSATWLETVLPDSELEHKPAVKDAWEKFQVVAGLMNVTVDKEYH
jgi:hypothetical protein